MPKKVVKNIQALQPIENEVEQEIPEEVITQSTNQSQVITQNEPIKTRKPQKGKKGSFAETQRRLILEEMRNVIRDEFINTWEIKQQKKKELKEIEEKARKEKEEVELYEAFKAFRQGGVNPISATVNGEKPKKVVPKEKSTCDFCKKEILSHNLPKHIASCFENPDGKYKDKFKYKFEKKPKKKQVEEVVEEVEEEVKESPKQASGGNYVVVSESIW